MERVTSEPIQGRGAVTNPTGRYEAEQVLPFDDEWGTIEEPPPRVVTCVQAEVTKTILSSNRSPDLSFDLSLNPYKGCEHGCIYCYARPSHAWLGLSPGLDFETKITSKPDAARLLRKEFRGRAYRPQAIVLGANTDPYQPIEEDLRISRSVLEVMAEYRHPVAIITKSARVKRDLDLLVDLARNDLVQVMVSVTTLVPQLARRMEPRASAPARRLAVIKALADAGVPVGVMVAPVIPALTDPELEQILEACRDAGATSAGYIHVRLPMEVATLFEDWLQEHYPDRATRVMDRIRDSHGGDVYRSEFGVRMRGTGVFAKLLNHRFRNATRRLGLNVRRNELSTEHFRIPPKDERQLRLFEVA